MEKSLNELHIICKSTRRINVSGIYFSDNDSTQRPWVVVNFDQIENSMKSALMERSKIRSCFINDSTGNLLYYDNNKYIITSRHVADDFFSNNTKYVLLRNNKKIYKENLEYVAKTNLTIDIAVIKIVDYEELTEFYTIDDFDFINDFNLADFHQASFFIFGYPTQLKYEKDNKEFILWMSYLTLKKESVSSTEDFLYLDYPRDSEKNILSENKIKTILPKAPGLSGAFIFRINTFHEKIQSSGCRHLLKLLQFRQVGIIVIG